MPLGHREVKTVFLCGFARLRCANLHVLGRLCASTKPRTFIHGGALGCMGVLYLLRKCLYEVFFVSEAKVTEKLGQFIMKDWKGRSV